MFECHGKKTGIWFIGIELGALKQDVEKVRQRRSRRSGKARRAVCPSTSLVYASASSLPAALLDLAPPKWLRAGERAFLNILPRM